MVFKETMADLAEASGRSEEQLIASFKAFMSDRYKHYSYLEIQITQWVLEKNLNER